LTDRTAIALSAFGDTTWDVETRTNASYDYMSTFIPSFKTWRDIEVHISLYKVFDFALNIPDMWTTPWFY